MAQPPEIRERMAERVEHFVYKMIVEVFNAADTAPLGVESILKANSRHVGFQAKSLEDPKLWTVSKIIEKGAAINSDKGPAGDFDD